MIRPILTELAMFIVPFALYAVFLWATKAGVMNPQSWPLSRVLTLIIVALILMVAAFFYLAEYTGAPVGTNYVPAHMENGKFVPGQMK